MFACTESVGLEVAAFTEIHTPVAATDRYLVGAFILRVMNRIVRIHRMIAEVFYCEAAVHGSQFSQFPLPLLEGHLCGFGRMG